MNNDHIKARGAATMPRALVLDDDPDTLALLGKLLSAIPVDAIPAATCAAARYAAQTVGPFDLIICDARLPDGNGVDVAIALQRQNGCATVIMSGDPAPDGGLPVGVDLWIMKPIRLPELEQAIKTLARPLPLSRGNPTTDDPDATDESNSYPCYP